MNEAQKIWCRDRIKTSASDTFADMEKRKFVPVKKGANDGGFSLSAAQARN